ncbi:DsbA family protein [Segnochrobactraceae bacterium EtOH-i3]
MRFASAATALVGAALLFAPVARAETAPDPALKAQVEGIVRDYLLAHPEILIEMTTKLEAQRAAEEAAEARNLIRAEKQALFEGPGQVVLGNPDGDVTLVEFFDYNCGYCRQASGDLARLIESDKNLRVVLKEFPVLGEGSVEAAQVAVAVNRVAPERYGPFHYALLHSSGQANRAAAIAAAEKAGVDRKALDKALADSAGINAELQKSYGLATRLGLTGTPSWVVGPEIIVGAVGVDNLKQKISNARACGTEC